MAPFPSWHFREMDRGEINVDPVHDEFFKAQDLADALVREAVQNSLDARRGHSTVRVRFRFAVDDQALAPDIAERYLLGLHPHLDAVAPHLQTTLPDLTAPMPYLVVEDAGTRGLTGDPGSDPELEEEEGARNDFYYFWRNVGRSHKGELDRGRWGLGKAVFSVSSRIRTMFGLTHRADDDRRLLLGQSVLKTHITNGRRHAPYGFFAALGYDSFPHAIANSAAIDRFIDDFRLQRSEPGLSIIVPFHRDDDLRFEQIVASAIRQYFYPITRGDLIVTVEENGIVETIRAGTIDALAEEYASDDHLARLCELTRWSVTLPDEEWIAIPEPSTSGAPKWRDDVLPPRTIELLRHRFEAGDRLAFRAGIPVRRKRSRAALSFFAVILEKDERLRRGEHHFIRRGITIPEVRSPRDKPVRALLIADDEPLSTFLGDAENPAHSDWSERNDKVRNTYENSASTLRYVKNAIAQIATLVSTPPAGRAPDLLAELFSVTIPAEEAEAPRKARPEAGAGESPDPRLTVKAAEQAKSIRIAPLPGGFTLRGSGLRDVGVPFTAEVAYRTRNGNPFRKYSPFDFTIGGDGIALAVDGATLRRVENNRFELLPTRPDFHVALTGFDVRRDLIVRVSRKDDDAAETELH